MRADRTKYQADYFQKNKERKTANARVVNAALRDRNRKYVDGIKAQSGCLRCGINDIRVLDFHHRNPSEKCFCVGTLRGASGSLEKIDQEISKCDLLCANCHRIVEAEK